MFEYNLKTSLNNNVLTVEIILPLQTSYEYAYYLYKDGERIETKWYSDENIVNFTLSSDGAYYVTCFVRDKNNQNNIQSQNTNLIMLPPPTHNNSKAAANSIYDDSFTILSSINDNTLTCTVSFDLSNNTNYEFAFYLMNKSKKISTTGYSPYNHVSFTLPALGIYSVKCFIKSREGMVVKTSSLHGYQCKNDYHNITDVNDSKNTLFTPYISYDAPYTDFCLIMAKKVNHYKLFKIQQHTKLSSRTIKWANNSTIYLIGNKKTIQSDTILSGIINEGEKLFWGQKDIDALKEKLTQNVDSTTMTGKFMLYSKRESITITCDYFGANTVFYYWDNETAIVSNRLNLLLICLNALNINTEINFEYVAATMSFNDRLISGTNFSNELAIKNLHILPLNQYIELKPNNFMLHEKNVNYEKIPYDADSYLNLLHRAKDDMLQKLKNIMNSNDISKYTMSLSGGFDSRLNLAVLLNNSDACKSIGVTTRDVETSNDLGVSLWLTNYFNLSYAQYDDYKMHYCTLSLKDFITHYLNFNSGMYHTIHQQPGTVLKSSVEKETINIVGMFGESMRSRYYKDTNHLITNEDSISQIVNKIACKLDINRMSFIDSSFFRKTLYQEIENTPGIDAYEKFDNLNTFYQLRYHLNDLTDKANGDGHYFSLFLSPYLFQASRMLTMEERCNNKVMLDMCYILCPKVLSFPFSSYGSRDEELTYDYWRNVIFDYNALPNVELNDDRSKYDIIHKDYSEALQTFDCLEEDNLLNELYSYTITVYHKLQKCYKIGKCFDENMYYYIQCIRYDKRRLTYVLSKMLGIWQQVSAIVDSTKS